jgi:hypothetical protein
MRKPPKSSFANDVHELEFVTISNLPWEGERT